MFRICSSVNNWSTLKSAVFGLSSSLPPIVGGGGGVVCESVGTADLPSDHFDGKQSRSLLICRSLAIRLETDLLCLQVE